MILAGHMCLPVPHESGLSKFSSCESKPKIHFFRFVKCSLGYPCPVDSARVEHSSPPKLLSLLQGVLHLSLKHIFFV